MPTAELPALPPVPVIRAELEGPHEVELVLRVGIRDEPPHLAGITHLAEHLIMRLAGAEGFFANGRSEASSVVFGATASAAGCADFLGRICTAIRDIHLLTDAQVALELAIIESEDRMRFDDVAPSLATIRFGFGGFGLVGAGTPALASITRDDVIGWVRERFTADRAVVLLTGPWAEEAPIALLPGAPAGRIRDEPAPTGTATPVAVPTPHPGVALSVTVPAHLVLALDHAISSDAFRDLRHERGLAYAVDVHTRRIDASTHQLDLVVGAPPARVREAAVAMVELARRLAREGFSAQAVAHGRTNAELLREDARRLVRIRASAEADALLFGDPRLDVDQKLRADANRDGEELRAAWATAFASPVVMFDEDADTGDQEAFSREIGMPIDDLAPSSLLSVPAFDAAVKGIRVWRDSLIPTPGCNRMSIDGTRLLVRFGSRAWAIDLTRIVVAALTEETVTIVSDDGRMFHIGRRSLRDAESLVDALVSRLREIAPERVRVIPAS